MDRVEDRAGAGRHVASCAVRDSRLACDTQKWLRHDGVFFIGTGSGDHLRELDEVPPWVGEKRQPAADDGQLKWLGDDRHAAPAEFGYGFIDAGNVETKVMEAREAQAVGQILIHWLRNRAGLAVAEQLDEERIVRCWREVGKVLIRIGPLVHDPEIELLDVPSFRGSEVRHAHGNVVAPHRSERTLLVTSRNVDDGHDGALVVLQWYEATRIV